MNYPEWLKQYNASWSSLHPAFREYFLRRVGYDTREDEDALQDTPESESLVKEWLYDVNLDSHIWCAKGFQQARVVSESDNLSMWNDSGWLLLVAWLAMSIYEEGVVNGWWDDTITHHEFCGQYSWAKVL